MFKIIKGCFVRWWLDDFLHSKLTHAVRPQDEGVYYKRKIWFYMKGCCCIKFIIWLNINIRCRFTVWFPLQYLPQSFSLIHLSTKWGTVAAYWVLTEQCIMLKSFITEGADVCPSFQSSVSIKKPARVISASLLFSRRSGCSVERPRKPIKASSPTHPLSHEYSVPASADKLQKICLHIHSFSLYVPLSVSQCASN